MIPRVLYSELLTALSRAITGQLYTDQQIKAITSGAIGKYFADFLPVPKDKLQAQERVRLARGHITAATSIISGMQKDLETQDRKLEELLREVEQKKQLAERYQAIAETNQETFNAFKLEMEEALRKELQEQANKGKKVRQAVSFFLWIVTLFAGAALGTYFKNVVTWFN